MPMTFRISGAYGELSEVRGNVPHNGIDIPLPTGTRLRSFVDGTVERVIDYGNQNIGKGVVIRGEDGNAYIYGHLSKITVEKGQHIEAAKDIIGLSGNTGHSTGPHLHFSVQMPNGEFVDPTPAIKALEQVTGADPLGHYLGSQPLPGGFMDKLNHLADGLWGKEKAAAEAVSHPVFTWFKGMLVDAGHWLVVNMPDIMGYGAILAGIIIVLGSMTGKSGMIKPLAVYAGLLILAICILAG